MLKTQECNWGRIHFEDHTCLWRIVWEETCGWDLDRKTRCSFDCCTAINAQVKIHRRDGTRFFSSSFWHLWVLLLESIRQTQGYLPTTLSWLFFLRHGCSSCSRVLLPGDENIHQLSTGLFSKTLSEHLVSMKRWIVLKRTFAVFKVYYLAAVALFKNKTRFLHFHEVGVCWNPRYKLQPNCYGTIIEISFP